MISRQTVMQAMHTRTSMRSLPSSLVQIKRLGIASSIDHVDNLQRRHNSSFGDVVIKQYTFAWRQYWHFFNSEGRAKYRRRVFANACAFITITSLLAAWNRAAYDFDESYIHSYKRANELDMEPISKLEVELDEGLVTGCELFAPIQHQMYCFAMYLKEKARGVAGQKRADEWIALTSLDSTEAQKSVRLSRGRDESTSKSDTASGTPIENVDELMEYWRWLNWDTMKKIEIEDYATVYRSAVNSIGGRDIGVAAQLGYVQYSYDMLKGVKDALEKDGVVRCEGVLPLEKVRDIRDRFGVTGVNPSPASIKKMETDLPRAMQSMKAGDSMEIQGLFTEWESSFFCQDKLVTFYEHCPLKMWIPSIGRRIFDLRNTPAQEFFQPLMPYLMPFVNAYFDTKDLSKPGQPDDFGKFRPERAVKHTPYLSTCVLICIDPIAVEEFWRRDNRSPGLSVVIPLTRLSSHTDAGGQKFWLGSHKCWLPNLPFRALAIGSKTVEGKVGDVIMYDSQILSRGSHNKVSNRSFIALQLAFDVAPPPGAFIHKTILDRVSGKFFGYMSWLQNLDQKFGFGNSVQENDSEDESKKTLKKKGHSVVLHASALPGTKGEGPDQLKYSVSMNDDDGECIDGLPATIMVPGVGRFVTTVPQAVKTEMWNNGVDPEKLGEYQQYVPAKGLQLLPGEEVGDPTGTGRSASRWNGVVPNGFR